MPECDYCGASFDDEEAELKHLKAEHDDELGRIDRRRLEGADVDDEGLPVGPIAIGAVLLITAAIVVYVVFIAGGGETTASGEPHSVGSVHEHGTIEVVIEGEALNLEGSRVPNGDNAFHFHDGYREQYGIDIYHAHAQGVTVQYALEAIGIEVNDEGTVLEFEGETYDDGDAGTEVRITVDGDPVAPADHVLDGVPSEDRAAEGDGDSVRVVVETGG